MHPKTRFLLAPLFLVVAACGGGGSTVAVVTPVAAPRQESSRTAGSADALAGELMAAAGRVQDAPVRALRTVADPALAAALGTLAFDHLRTAAYGAGNGPDVVGSRRILRLAAASTAPADSNGSGSNRDETLAQDVQRLAAAAGAAVPIGLLLPLLPWAEAETTIANAVTPTGDAPQSWRTQQTSNHTVTLLDIAGALHARVRATQDLCRTRRGTLFGQTPDDGLFGVLSLQQAVAIEEELVVALSTNSGTVLGAFADPHTYDPASGRRWFPAEFEALPATDGSITYRVRDQASDLASLAALLDAAAELAWYSGTTNPSATTQALFAGPFAPPPPQNPPTLRSNYQEDILPILSTRCSECHFFFGTGNFRCDTYALLLAGTPRTRSLGHTMVIPGNSAASLLHRIVTTPPPFISRMPPFPRASVTAAELAIIDTWINEGALENPEVPPAPPRPGEDLALVCFENIVSMHLDQSSGALQHRHEGDQASGIATAAATGRTLSALAHLRAARPTLAYAGLTVTAALTSVANYAIANLLQADGRAVDDVVIQSGARGRAADLATQAVFAAGLLEAARSLGTPALQTAATSAATALLRFRDAATGLFRADPEHAFTRYTPRLLADLLAALRSAAAQGNTEAAAAHDQLLARLLPTMSASSWGGAGGLPLPADVDAALPRLPLLTAAILVGRADDAPPFDAPITWSQHVRPLLLAKCGECHFGGSSQGGYRCDTMQLLATPGGENGNSQLLVPGDAERSFLWRKLVDRVPATGAQMPLQRTMLDDRARATVQQWIDAGATAR